MKIFDFTNGTKGKSVGEFRFGFSSGKRVTKNGKTFSVELVNPNNREFFDSKRGTHTVIKTQWCMEAGNSEDKTINPEDFGCEAVIFCTGCFSTNHGKDEEWDWLVVGTTDWNRKALKQGILTAKKL
tara:strand:- start:21323 stop:21703 length:381 start_codon:yes stop_codon:yes gene_type:complete